VMVGRDDAFRRDGEAGGERVVPLRALVALIGGADEHGRLGAATIDLRARERGARSGAGGEAERVGAAAPALLQALGAAHGDIAFLRECVRLFLQLAEQLAVIRRAVDVDAGDRRGAEDAGREQRGEKHAVIEANDRRETRQWMRIRREHTDRWRTCDSQREAWADRRSWARESGAGKGEDRPGEGRPGGGEGPETGPKGGPVSASDS